MDAADVTRQLEGDAYCEAAEVLEMISTSPEDGAFYEARMKFHHDEEGRLIAAREAGMAAGRNEGREEGLVAGREAGIAAGRKEGMARGAIVGKIQTLSEFLGDRVPDVTELQTCSSGELDILVAQLRERFGSRGR